MSSNNHTNPVINSSNYEEWFLLYVDEELNAAERKAVEVFAAAHPHLQEELDLLCNTRLPMDTVRLENKQELFSGNMKMNTVEESLLLYIDNELTQSERKSIEARLASDQDFQLQYLLLLKTKADAPVIEFPHKKSLYRRTERRIVPLWLRAAAAVLLVAGTGAAFWLTGDNGTDITTPPTVATQPAQKNKTSRDHQLPGVIAQKQPDVAVNAVAAQPEDQTATAKKASKSFYAVTNQHIADEKKPGNNLPVPQHQDDHQIADVDIKNETPKSPQQNINSQAVTLLVDESYNNTVVTTTPEFANTITSPESNEKSGTIKGFLRKATRFIERRTGVTATNENDELLIGAVAIKLK